MSENSCFLSFHVEKNTKCCVIPSMLIAQLMFSLYLSPSGTSSTFRSARNDGEVLFPGGKSGRQKTRGHPHSDNVCIIILSDLVKCSLVIQPYIVLGVTVRVETTETTQYENIIFTRISSSRVVRYVEKQR